MRGSSNIFSYGRKAFFRCFLFMSIIVILFLSLNKNIDNLEVFYEDYDLKDYYDLEPDIKESTTISTTWNKTQTNKNCPKKFGLLKLHHLNEKYDDVIIERHPNLPKFLTESNIISSSLPSIQNIRWTGTVFQESWKDSPKFLLYSAHFDTRLNSNLFIHLLALYDGDQKLGLAKVKKFFCQIWFSIKEDPVVVPIYDALLLEFLKFGRDRLNPYVLSCQVPKQEKRIGSFPVAVSIVKQICQTPTNVLKISSSPMKKKEESLKKNISIGICGKALFYYNEDFSSRLIEWIEILKILGASKIFFYKTKCHKNVKKVLDFYEKVGTVTLITFNYPSPYDQEGTFLRLWTKTKKKAYRATQKIFINDCLQRHKDDFDYLAVFDCDEIPILKNHHSFQDFLEFMRIASEKRPENYFLRWKTFFQNLNSKPSALNETDRSYSFRHNIRTKLTSRDVNLYETNGKTFYDTNQLAWAGAHRHLSEKYSKIAPRVRMKVVSRKVAYMGHFSSHKCRIEENCIRGNLKEETALLPIREEVVRSMNRVLALLHV